MKQGKQFIHVHSSSPLVRFFIFLSLSLQFLDLIGKKHSKFYVVNGMLLIFSFFMCRIVWGGFVSYVFYTQSEKAFRGEISNPVPVWFTYTARVINVALNVLNCFWFSKMLKFAIRTLRRQGVTKKTT